MKKVAGRMPVTIQSLEKTSQTKERYSMAVEFFNKALELSHENVEAWKLKGESLLNKYEIE